MCDTRDRTREHATTRRLVCFNVVGAIGIAVQMALLALLVHLAVHYMTATAIAVEASLLQTFYLHRKWTWADRFRAGGQTRTALVRFHMTAGAVSIGGNLVLMHYLVGEAGLHLLVANGVTIAVCALFNFLLADRYVFT